MPVRRGAKPKPDVERYRAVLRRAREVLALCTTRTFDAPEDAFVGAIGERYGYGAVMSAASKMWAMKLRALGLPDAQHTCGPTLWTVQKTLAEIDDALGGGE